MRRRLGREDLRDVSPVLQDKEYHADFSWEVYEDYEIVEQEDGLAYQRAVPQPGYEESQEASFYYPLVDTPHLFLDFARIVESRDPDQAHSQWVHTYGLLGLAHEGQGFFAELIPDVVMPPKQYDPRGGPGETLAAFWYYAKTSNEILVLYEAALNRDAEKLERVLYSVLHTYELQEDQERIEQGLYRAEKEGADRTDCLIGLAVSQIWAEVGYTLASYAFPALGFRGEPPEDYWLLSMDRLMPSWGVRNLLGAMYLQFYWLITSAGNLSRCKMCGRIISYAVPIPVRSADRKPRKDKKFCSLQCRQNYHYQNRVKPARKGKSA